MDVRTRGVWQALLVVTAFASLATSDLSLTAPSNNVVRCDNARAIVACQFKSLPDGGVVEPSNPMNEWLNMTTFALSSGTCSVTLFSKFDPEGVYLIACRMQEMLNGSWIQKEEVIYRNNDTSLGLKPLTQTQSLTTSLTAGVDSVTVSVTGRSVLTNCSFYVPGHRKPYPGGLSNNAPGPAGTGPTEWSCSRAIPSAQSGVEVVVARVLSGGVDSWALAAGKPTMIEPKLTLPNVTTLSAGDAYDASCLVAANSVVVWTLDEYVIYEANCFMESEWPWSFQNSKPYTATFDRPVTWEYNGRRLGCHTKMTAAPVRAIDTSTTPLDVRFAPYLIGVTWNRTWGGSFEATVQVAANPSANISWTIGDIHGERMPMETKSPGYYEGFQKIANASSDSLAVSFTLENSEGSTTYQLLSGPAASDMTWLVVLSGVLGALCLALLVAVLVLVLPRYRRLKPGASRRLTQGSRRKTVESGIYAEPEEPVEYDDIWQWQPEYEDVDLPMRPPNNLDGQRRGPRD